VVRTTYDGWSPFLKPGAVLVVHNSRPGYRRETHDGSARLVEELIRPPDYGDVRYVGSMTFARKLRGRAAQSRAGGSTRMKVSVSLITYDHERFIAQAIESVLSQKADFEWELVVGDDCSTDRTGEIVGEFAERYPGRIRVLPSERNFGLVGNFVRTFRACRGEYVALLDGDDYWTNPLKLQRQAEFLDSHPECSICFHDAAVLLPDDTVCGTNYTAADQKEISSVEDLFATNFIATCSAMLRRGAVPELPSWYAGCLWEDWPLYILYAERGKIGYLNEVMAVYRNHGRGLWSALDSVEQLEAVIRFLLDMDDHLGHRYRAAIESSVSKYRNRLVVAERDQTIRDLQAELHAKVGEANRVIRDLQGELHAKVGECNRIIQDLQERLEGTGPAAASGGSASAREG
jgi:glycosyltransferase involved in cell wall biosynthesis